MGSRPWTLKRWSRAAPMSNVPFFGAPSTYTSAMAPSDEVRLDRSVGRKYRLGEEPAEEPIADGLAHIWPITRACWALAHPDMTEEPRMRRDIAVLKRRSVKKSRRRSG